MREFFLATLRAGLRGRVFIGVLVCGVALMGVAYLSAFFSPRQPSTVALDVGLTGLRISLVLFVLSLVQELVGKEIDRRTVILTFSYPVGRSAYVLGRYFGVAALAGLAALGLGLLLLLATFASGANYQSDFGLQLGMPFVVTVAGLWLDACVVAAFALLIATLSTVSALPLILGLIFSVTAKSLGAVADYLAQGADGDTLLVARYSGPVDLIFWVLPDLSRLDWREWPMYGLMPEREVIVFAVLMAVAYVATMLMLGIRHLERREFS